MAAGQNPIVRVITARAPTEGDMRRQKNTANGMTMIELLIVMAILAIVAGIAVPSYQRALDAKNDAAAKEAIVAMQGSIDTFYAVNRYYPTVAEVFPGGAPEDKWGNRVMYLPIDGYPQHLAHVRRDANFVPLNTDYDLWSKGKDKSSHLVINSESSQDDILRAANGRFLGRGEEY